MDRESSHDTLKNIMAVPVSMLGLLGTKLLLTGMLEMCIRDRSDCPAGMAQAIGKVVHEGYTPKQAFEVYETVKNQ